MKYLWPFIIFIFVFYVTSSMRKSPSSQVSLPQTQIAEDFYYSKIIETQQKFKELSSEEIKKFIVQNEQLILDAKTQAQIEQLVLKSVKYVSDKVHPQMFKLGYTKEEVLATSISGILVDFENASYKDSKEKEVILRNVTNLFDKYFEDIVSGNYAAKQEFISEFSKLLLYSSITEIGTNKMPTGSYMSKKGYVAILNTVLDSFLHAQQELNK